MDNNFVDGNHALVSGEVLGACLRAYKDSPIDGVHIQVDKDGDYQDFFLIEKRSGKYKVTVEPYYE